MEIFFVIVCVIVFWVIVAVLLGGNSKPSESSEGAKVNIKEDYKPRLNQEEFDKYTSTKIAATLNKTTHEKELKKLDARQKARDKAIYTYWSGRGVATDMWGARHVNTRWKLPQYYTTQYYPMSSYHRFMELKARREKHYK
jgi:hypothetical protein